MEWIKITDRLPITNDPCLCFGYSGIFIGVFDPDFKYWHSTKYLHAECLEDYEPVTHWMPLPEMPNANK